MSAAAIAKLDETILRALRAAGLTDTLRYGSIEVEGYFLRGEVSEGAGADLVVGELITFDCRETELPAIEQEERVEIVGHGTFRYLARHRAGIGRVMVELGTVLGDEA